MESKDAPKPQPMEFGENKKFRISLSKLTAWVEENQISSNCPFCGTSSWTVPQNSTIIGCAFPWGDGWGEMFTGGMPVVPLVCNKCFFVRSMALDRGLRDIIAEEVENAS